MKPLSLLALAITAALVCAARAQSIPATNSVGTNAIARPTVIARDANTRVWARVTPVTTVLTTRS